jgi:hypothetical protein
VIKLDDSDVDLPIDIVHNIQWFNAADNDDPCIESNCLFYRFESGPEETVVLVDLEDPLSATIINPDDGRKIADPIVLYLRKRFEFVKQATGNGYITLWNEWT